MTEQTDNQQPSLDKRICRKCGVEKTVEEFSIVYSQNSRGKQYKSHTCMICHRIKSADKERKRRADNPECARATDRKNSKKNAAKRKISQKNNYNILKDDVFMAYGGYVCVCCGETEKSMLTMDHVNNDGSKHRRELKMRWSGTMYRWIKENGFPKTFQVLCYNCNISKFRNGGFCGHKIKEGSTTIPLWE